MSWKRNQQQRLIDRRIERRQPARPSRIVARSWEDFTPHRLLLVQSEPTFNPLNEESVA